MDLKDLCGFDDIFGLKLEVAVENPESKTMELKDDLQCKPFTERLVSYRNRDKSEKIRKFMQKKVKSACIRLVEPPVLHRFPDSPASRSRTTDDDMEGRMEEAEGPEKGHILSQEERKQYLDYLKTLDLKRQWKLPGECYMDSEGYAYFRRPSSLLNINLYLCHFQHIADNKYLCQARLHIHPDGLVQRVNFPHSHPDCRREPTEFSKWYLEAAGVNQQPNLQSMDPVMPTSLQLLSDTERNAFNKSIGLKTGVPLFKDNLGFSYRRSHTIQDSCTVYRCQLHNYECRATVTVQTNDAHDVNTVQKISKIGPHWHQHPNPTTEPGQLWKIPDTASNDPAEIQQSSSGHGDINNLQYAVETEEANQPRIPNFLTVLIGREVMALNKPDKRKAAIRYVDDLGFHYYCSYHAADNTVTYRCCRVQCKCNARVVVRADGSFPKTIVAVKSVHNHSSNPVNQIENVDTNEHETEDSVEPILSSFINNSDGDASFICSDSTDTPGDGAVNSKRKILVEPTATSKMKKIKASRPVTDNPTVDATILGSSIKQMPKVERNKLMQELGIPHGPSGTWFLDQFGYTYRLHHLGKGGHPTYHCQLNHFMHQYGMCPVKVDTIDGVIVNYCGTHTHPNPTTETSQTAIWRTRILEQMNKGKQSVMLEHAAPSAVQTMVTSGPNQKSASDDRIPSSLAQMSQLDHAKLMQALGRMRKRASTLYVDDLGYTYKATKVNRDHTTYKCQFYTIGTSWGHCNVVFRSKDGRTVYKYGEKHTHPNPTTHTSQTTAWRNKLLKQSNKGASCARPKGSKSNLNAYSNDSVNKLRCMTASEVQEFNKAMGIATINNRKHFLYIADDGFTYHKREMNHGRRVYCCSFYCIRGRNGFCSAKVYTGCTSTVVSGSYGSHTHANPRHETEQLYAWRSEKINEIKSKNAKPKAIKTVTQIAEADKCDGSDKDSYHASSITAEFDTCRSSREDGPNTPAPATMPLTLDTTITIDDDDVIMQDMYPLLYTCTQCEAVVVVPGANAYSMLMQAGSAHILQYHKDQLPKEATFANRKMICTFFPHMQAVESKVPGSALDVGDAVDWQEYACKLCGKEKLVNMPDETLHDNVLVNHAYTHLKQGGTLTSKTFWMCYPSLEPKFQKKTKIKTI